ncbi:hypothetical protein JMJ58_05280 [Haloterrigena salifodinae]|uniref:Uncharacterized protein n=1 Tax=Haloterrigena salifodinae TaxID=2675099 RepID=A0A8T8E389_9EURY|nr:hypothetical protein [Haloterrigena salifodinae]QRV16305.1 hypothetical protein JMJ58_05280 [Haloterrigena salifodinae]
MSSATTTADRGGQQLTYPNACWMRANHQMLDAHLPEPGATWRWSDTGLSRSILCDLRNRGLIEKCDGEWWTTRRCWRALERYGDADEDERGEIVGQQTLDAYVEETPGNND